MPEQYMHRAAIGYLQKSVAKYIIQFNPSPCQDFGEAFSVKYKVPFCFCFLPETSSAKYSTAHIYWKITACYRHTYSLSPLFPGDA